ncbi:hypothetical protein SKAU_G00427440 [Synaphobranchus kaupii]|uniref:Uncharacterized protein n=1 Tax=Synaphobranchus kaupii TaxID=118154 RepID=A0A9Q1E4T6_SYNKA|nr:hypothetical protein SKAU_G00427440 [Synaphobranchus kaupii]
MMTCQPGSEYDKLVKDCVQQAARKPQQATAPLPVLRAGTEAPSLHASVVSPSVWIPVVVVVNGSILALFLWFIIYRRQMRHSAGSHDQSDCNAPADTEAVIYPGLERAGRTDSAAVEREGPPTSCPHINGGPKGLLKPEVPTWRDAFECDAGGSGGGNVHMCNGRKDHGIPVPATELGEAALVTAKTAQYTE